MSTPIVTVAHMRGGGGRCSSPFSSSHECLHAMFVSCCPTEFVRQDDEQISMLLAPQGKEGKLGEDWASKGGLTSSEGEALLRASRSAYTRLRASNCRRDEAFQAAARNLYTQCTSPMLSFCVSSDLQSNLLPHPSPKPTRSYPSSQDCTKLRVQYQWPEEAYDVPWPAGSPWPPSPPAGAASCPPAAAPIAHHWLSCRQPPPST